ncbi:MAG: hypothetical protein J6A94_10630 [Lachnospiraceae bacterium]|nr:hypothetical protein [Lachnospiraceae bacterium]
MRKRAYNAIAFWGILAVLAGCGSEKVSVSEEIVLVEPVSGSVESQPVLYRNLYDGEVYSASVLPDIREYAFEESAEVERFVAFPGTQVEAGETLVYSDTESLEEEIQDLEEQIAEMEKEFQEYKQDAETLLWEYQHDTENYEEMVDGLKEDEPEEYLVGVDGEKTENPDYDAWEKEYTQLSGKYHKEELNAFMQEAELQQKTELYQLDHAYYLEKLEALKKNRENRILKTGAKGQVVAIAQTEYETVKAAANEAVVAVGDFSRKLLICDYLKKSRITKAEEIYALIAGKKYELEYLPMESEEYIRLTESGEDVYTTFEIKNPSDEITVGDYAVIVVMNKRCEQVLTVLKDAIDRDGATHYVYVVENGEGVRRNVKVGYSDGLYTEIVSGLSEGEQVMVAQSMSYGNQETVLEKGTYSNLYMQSGYMYYPAITEIKNPIVYGTAYYEKNQVQLYQHVEKGDVIATIRVEADTVTIQRNQRKLQRLRERLQDLLDEGISEKNEDAILEKQEAIAELETIIADRQKDANTTEIIAPKSGIVVKLEDFMPDEVLKADATIVQIADEETCYVMVENENGLLQYGNEVTVSYTDEEKKECKVTGRVANIAGIGISKALQTESAFILLPAQSISAMAGMQGTEDTVRRISYRVTAEAREMQNVVLIPREAVTELAGRTYVHIIEADGSIKAQSFLPGGRDGSYYWAIEGVTEGMKVCLE